MREWLIVIIGILIVGILIDGVRRMLRNRRNSLRMRRLKDDGVYHENEEISTSEFPSGGARIAGVRDEDALLDVNQNLKESYVASRMTRGIPTREEREEVEAFDSDEKNEVSFAEPEIDEKPEQSSFDLQTTVPMLMESIANAGKQNDSRENEPAIGNLDDLDENLADVPADKVGVVAEAVVSSERKPRVKPSKSKRVSKKAQQKAKLANEAPPAAPDEVLVIHMMAKKDQVIPGADLLKALLAEGLRFGDMGIFHRHETDDGDGPVVFSLANLVMPGTFDLQKMDDFSTPGISLFLSLPIQGDSIAAYDLMALTAHNLSQAIGGELKDENRSVMTRQTIEHGRQRVVEYERKRRLAKGKQG